LDQGSGFDHVSPLVQLSSWGLGYRLESAWSGLGGRSGGCLPLTLHLPRTAPTGRAAKPLDCGSGLRV